MKIKRHISFGLGDLKAFVLKTPNSNELCPSKTFTHKKNIEAENFLFLILVPEHSFIELLKNKKKLSTKQFCIPVQGCQPKNQTCMYCLTAC